MLFDSARISTLISIQNFALSLFFTRFNPIFPILHAPTFQPNKHNSLLLLSICSIGCLFMGSNGASAQGSRIFERLNKVILASVRELLLGFSRISAK
jgi:Fungal specific transcription factor domain